MSNIILIGMPSSGKSTIGKRLAQHFGYCFLDGDTRIISEEHVPLSEIIKRQGTEGFIAVEERVNCSINCVHTVIATGGSAIYSPRAMEHLKSLGVVVYLKLSAAEIKRRIRDFVARGVVMRGNITTLDGLYAERAPLYEKYADITFVCDEKSSKENAVALAALLDRTLSQETPVKGEQNGL